MLRGNFYTAPGVAARLRHLHFLPDITIYRAGSTGVHSHKHSSVESCLVRCRTLPGSRSVRCWPRVGDGPYYYQLKCSDLAARSMAGQGHSRLMHRHCTGIEGVVLANHHAAAGCGISDTAAMGFTCWAPQGPLIINACRPNLEVVCEGHGVHAPGHHLQHLQQTARERQMRGQQEGSSCSSTTQASLWIRCRQPVQQAVPVRALDRGLLRQGLPAQDLPAGQACAPGGALSKPWAKPSLIAKCTPTMHTINA